MMRCLNLALLLLLTIVTIRECDNSLLVCVCGWVECHVVSSEPAVDDFHAEDEGA